VATVKLATSNLAVLPFIVESLVPVPTPELATHGLKLLGMAFVFVMRKRIGQGFQQAT
jgi:hypothetical protein